MIYFKHYGYGIECKKIGVNTTPFADRAVESIYSLIQLLSVFCCSARTAFNQFMLGIVPNVLTVGKFIKII